MVQIWRGKEIHPELEYYNNFKPLWFGCDDGFTPLPVLINRCHLMIISKRRKPTDNTFLDFNKPRTPIDDIKVYVNQKVYDLFINTMTFNCRDFFTAIIDDTVQDDMVIVSTLDEEHIVAIQITEHAVYLKNRQPN